MCCLILKRPAGELRPLVSAAIFILALKSR